MVVLVIHEQVLIYINWSFTKLSITYIERQTMALNMFTSTFFMYNSWVLENIIQLLLISNCTPEYWIKCIEILVVALLLFVVICESLLLLINVIIIMLVIIVIIIIFIYSYQNSNGELINRKSIHRARNLSR